MMKIFQQHVFPFPKEMVYETIRDTKQLEQIVPMVTGIEEIDTNKYKVNAVLEAGPIKGRLNANLQILKELPPENMDVLITYKHILGNITGNFNVKLEILPNKKTMMTVQGNVKMTRLLKVAAYKIQPATVDSLMTYVFHQIRRVLRTKKLAQVAVAS